MNIKNQREQYYAKKDRRTMSIQEEVRHLFKVKKTKDGKIDVRALLSERRKRKPLNWGKKKVNLVPNPYDVEFTLKKIVNKQLRATFNKLSEMDKANGQIHVMKAANEEKFNKYR